MSEAEDAPERIWATVNGSSTRLGFDGFNVFHDGRQLVGGWSEYRRNASARRETEYIRADLVQAKDSALSDAAREARDAQMRAEGRVAGLREAAEIAACAPYKRGVPAGRDAARPPAVGLAPLGQRQDLHNRRPGEDGTGREERAFSGVAGFHRQGRVDGKD